MNKIIHTGSYRREGIKDTLVTVKDLDTGEILDQGSNSILYAGSINAALKDFCFYDSKYAKSPYGDYDKYLNTSGIAIPPNYDIALLGKSTYSDGTSVTVGAEGPVCLFAVGIDGVESSIQSSQRKAVKYEGWIHPDKMCAFRVVPTGSFKSHLSLSDVDPTKYAVCKTYSGKDMYYFKKFESKPLVYTQREHSGDPIPVLGTTVKGATDAIKYYDDNLINYQEGSQVIVQMNCKVTPDEIREWFDVVQNQPNNCNISSIMICTAIPVVDDSGNIVEYRNIQPKSKRHITRELLLEATKGLEIIYQYLY